MRATLLMTVRERHGLTLETIASIRANTAIPYRLLFAHDRLPRWLGEALSRKARDGEIELRPFDGVYWPQQARKALIGEVDTEYVVFIDNDIHVSPGWLERLIACADETGCGAVGPLYLWSDSKSPPRIHMAGGTLERREGATVLHQHHLHMNADAAAMAASLRRAPTDFVEFHCMLVRTELARLEGVLDPAINCSGEHVDLALTLRGRGHGVFLEPAAQVTYRAFVPYTLEDLPVLRQRWNASEVEASIAAFSRKWGVDPDDRSFGHDRNFVRNIRQLNDPLRVDAAWDDLERPMVPDERVLTPSQLTGLALARRYPAPEVANLGRACNLAVRIFEGVERAGRPLIEHLIGTAGVLVRYDFRIGIVVAGLLHAAYTHRKLEESQVAKMLGGPDSPLERRVRDFTLQGGQVVTQTVAETSMRDAEVAAIEAARRVELRFGEEPRAAADASPRLAGILQLLGVPGFAATLQAS